MKESLEADVVHPKEEFVEMAETYDQPDQELHNTLAKPMTQNELAKVTKLDELSNTVSILFFDIIYVRLPFFRGNG